MLIPSGPADARMMIVTECVSYRDLQQNTILADREFDRMLDEAGVNRTRCFVTALIKGQVRGQTFDHQVALTKKAITPEHVPFHNRYVRRELVTYAEALGKDIDLVRPQVILAVGNGALFALTGKWGIKNWRSSLLEYTSPNGHKCLVIPTYAPGYIQAVWKDRNSCIHDIRKAWGHSQSDTLPEPPAYNFIIEPNFSTVYNTLTMLKKKADAGPFKLAVDVETRGGHLACTGIAWSKVDAICIPQIRAVVEEMHNWQDRIHYWRAEEECVVNFHLMQLLTHPNVEVIGQNFIYDAQYFYRWLLFVPRFKRDTMLAQHTMFSSMPKGLDVLSALHTAYHVYWKDESKNWDVKLGERQLWIYNCKDCCSTYEIDDSQQTAIDNWTASSWPQLREIHDFQQSLFWPVLDTMITGLRTDNASKERLSKELQEAIDERNAWIREVLGHDLNIKSPKQMTDLFYRVFNQKPILNRSSGNPTCDDAALERLATREPLLSSLVTRIRELRSLGVFRSTFLEAPVDIDQRMRCSFNIAGTETFRFSSSENAFNSGMNLQNVPSGDEEENLPNVRKLFIADEGYEYFDIDLDSADLRVVTWDSDCAGMKKYFLEGKKPYVEIAKEYFQDDSIDKTHDAYKAFKVICHGSNYDGGAGEIASRMPKSAKVEGLTVDGITRIQQWYFGRFPEIKDWQKRIESNLRSKRYVENVFGYRLWCFDRIEGTVVKQFIAGIPQSTVACLINRGYKAIHDNEPDIQILLQVHDSLAGQYPIAMRDYAVKKVLDHCAIPLPYASGELIIPVGIKTSPVSWGDCE